MQRSDSRGAKKREQLAEAGVVVEIEPEPHRVDEHELARHADLQLVLVLNERLGLIGQILHCVLYGRVLERVQADGAQRGVQRDDQSLPGPADEGVASWIPERRRRLDLAAWIGGARPSR